MEKDNSPEGTAAGDAKPASALPASGRNVYDTIIEILGMLGKGGPYAVFLIIILYSIQQVVLANNDKLEKVNKARTDALEKNAVEIARLNQIIRENAESIEKLRSAQLDGLNKALALNKSVTDTVSTSESALIAQREALLKAQAALSEAERKVLDAQQKQHQSHEDLKALEIQSNKARETIDAARRILLFLGNKMPPGTDVTSLSRRFETVGPDGIAREGNGAIFYGAFRLPASEMASFLKFLADSEPAMAKRLEDAGGIKGSREGDSSFVEEWRALNQDRRFDDFQVAWITAEHYRPFLLRLGRALTHGKSSPSPFAVEQRSVALQATLWSVVVQDGIYSPQVQRAWSGLDLDSSSDKTLICRIFDEREMVQKYRPGVSAEVITLLRARYALERSEALRMLPKLIGPQECP